MDGQDRDNTPVKFWVQTERRQADDPGRAWTQCCVTETVLSDHAENVRDAFSRHVTNARTDYQVSVWAVSEFTGTPVARSRCLFLRETETGVKHKLEQIIPAPQETPVAGVLDEEDPKEDVTPAASIDGGGSAAESPASDEDAGIDRAAAAGDVPGEEQPRLITEFEMAIEDQLKQAGAALEGALGGVLVAHKALGRKGPWWCYQDALAAVALAASGFTAAFLSWEATL